jgi:hypothetical protein
MAYGKITFRIQGLASWEVKMNAQFKKECWIFAFWRC